MVERSASAEEIASLRQELGLRILLQNVLLQILPLVFAILATVACLNPAASSVLNLVFQSVMLCVAMQWCHHGVRTAQIKAFLLQAMPQGAEPQWERWLPAHRPPTLLGTRWFISTKGVFLGLGAAMLVLDIAFLSHSQAWPIALACLLWGFAAALLLTNPKEKID